MAEIFKNRRGEIVETTFKFPYSPQQGVCAKCGKHIDAYESKVIDRNTGDIYCQNAECGQWAKAMFLMEHGMHDYSDG